MGQHEPQDALLSGAQFADETFGTVGPKMNGANSATEMEPIPLNEHAGRTSDFPIHCLGKFGKNMTLALQDLTQAPVALCAQGVLSAMSTSVSGWGQVEAIHGLSHPLAIYLALAAQSGERKSAVDGLVQMGIRVFEKEIAEKLGLAETEDTDAEISAGDNPEPDIIVSEPTYEGLLRVLARGPGFGCLSNDDAAGFFGGHAMSRENRQKMIAGLSQLWSGSTIKRPRMHGQDTSVSGIPLTICLMFQPYLVSSIFDDIEMNEQGILARVLPSYPVSTMGTRFFRHPNPASNDIIEAFARRCHEVLRQIWLHKTSRAPQTDPFKPSFPILRLSEDARAVLIELHDDIEAGLAPGGRYSQVRAFANRAVENATRLAGIITLFDDLEAPAVSKVAAEAGAELARFYIEEFSYLRVQAKISKDHGAAGQLGAWMAKEYGPGGIGHDKHVSQFGPQAFRKAGDRKPALDLLAAHRWIEFLPPGTVVDGSKRQTAFRVSHRIEEVV